MIDCLPRPRLVVTGPGYTGTKQTAKSRGRPASARIDRALDACPVPVTEILVDQEIRPGEIPSLETDESYTLSLETGAVRIEASTEFGVLHALTTLAQLGNYLQLQIVERIEDAPRFPWRGVLIDVARHFMPLALLRNVINGMAGMKLNVLHLHLTDDQGFRFESKIFPELASEQNYSQEELRQLVIYAADRGIRLVPEFDVPGHVTSWLTAYPAWGVRQVEPTQRFGVHEACLDPTDERLYEVLERLFKEVSEVFPDEYIHIGGDEVHPVWWSEDPRVQKMQAEKGLGDLRQVQNYFTCRVVEILGKLGKSPVGWDEVLHEEMPDMVVQNWRGVTTRDRIGARGLPCLFSAPYYLDLFYPAEMHYAYDPEAPQAELMALEDLHRQDLRIAHVSDGIGWTLPWRNEAVDLKDKSTQVLGGEGCLWAELVDQHTLETRLWSRLPALAERLWSAADSDIDDLYARMERLLEQPPYLLVKRQITALTDIGLTIEQAELAMLLEPVKWYARLLGQQALQARISGVEMPQARGYRTDTALDRVVDFISPESLSARNMRTSDEASWRSLAEVVLAQQLITWPADMQAVMAAFQRFAQAILSNDEAMDIAALYVPQGEYMLAVIPAWLGRE